MQTECSEPETVSCPECGGTDLLKYGKAGSGKQKYRCKNQECRHQFVAGSTYLIDEKTKRVIIALLAQGVEPVIISKAISDVSLRWIYELRRRMKIDGE